LSVKCNHRRAAPMTGSARNRVLVLFDFVPQLLNGNVAILFGTCWLPVASRSAFVGPPCTLLISEHLAELWRPCRCLLPPMRPDYTAQPDVILS